MSTTTTTTTNLIEAKELTLRYGSKTALERASFSIPKGRVVGLLGHNGAGKTSLMKALVGLLPGEGELTVLGLHPRRQRNELLEQLCYIPDVAVLPRWARVHELMTLMSGLQPRFSAERARELLKRTSVGIERQGEEPLQGHGRPVAPRLDRRHRRQGDDPRRADAGPGRDVPQELLRDADRTSGATASAAC